MANLAVVPTGAAPRSTEFERAHLKWRCAWHRHTVCESSDLGGGRPGVESSERHTGNLPVPRNPPFHSGSDQRRGCLSLEQVS